MENKSPKPSFRQSEESRLWLFAQLKAVPQRDGIYALLASPWESPLLPQTEDWEKTDSFTLVCSSKTPESKI